MVSSLPHPTNDARVTRPDLVSSAGFKHSVDGRPADAERLSQWRARGLGISFRALARPDRGGPALVDASGLDISRTLSASITRTGIG
jgi:hypothetical protein